MKRTSQNTTSKKKPINKSVKTVAEEYAEKYLFDPYWRNKRPNETFYRMFAVRMISWAKELIDKIQSGEFNPDVSWHPLTFSQFYREQGIYPKLMDSWVEDSPLVREAFEFTRSTLADLQHAAALWGKGNATHAAKTLGYYSDIFKEEQERIAKLSDNSLVSKGPINVYTTPIPNAPEVPFFDSHK